MQRDQFWKDLTEHKIAKDQHIFNQYRAEIPK